MSARSLFNIILKVLGIFFLKDILISLPALIGVFYEFGDGNVSGAISTLLISLFTLFIYFVVCYALVFRTEEVMEKLRLLDKTPEDPLPLNIHRSTVLSISILVVALYLITQAIPLLIRGLTKWYQYNRVARGLYTSMQPFDYSLVLVYAAEIVLGLLLVGYQQQLVNYIELKTRRKNS